MELARGGTTRTFDNRGATTPSTCRCSAILEATSLPPARLQRPHPLSDLSLAVSLRPHLLRRQAACLAVWEELQQAVHQAQHSQQAVEALVAVCLAAHWEPNQLPQLPQHPLPLQEACLVEQRQRSPRRKQTAFSAAWAVRRSNRRQQTKLRTLRKRADSAHPRSSEPPRRSSLISSQALRWRKQPTALADQHTSITCWRGAASVMLANMVSPASMNCRRCS